MGYRILYFYKKKDAFYREKSGRTVGGVRNGKTRQAVHVFWDEKELGGQGEEAFSARVYFCGVPEYYGRRKGFGRGKSGGRIFPVPWNFGQLLRLMQSCCEFVSADAYYLEESFEKELAEGEFGFTPGRQRMCAEMINRLSGQFKGVDSILYLADGTREQAGEMPLKEELLRKLHYFFYMGERDGRYDVLEENLWQGYGMPLIIVKKPEELATCQLRRLLVLDDRQEGRADWEMLPRGCAYLDLWSDAGRRRRIAEKRLDIKYMSEYLYLRQNLDTP